MHIFTIKSSVGCCTLTTPLLCNQTEGVVMGQHPTNDMERGLNATLK